jgi:hypothetical protein
MEFLKRLLIVANLVISTSPLYAQRQQQNVASDKVDVLLTPYDRNRGRITRRR